MNSTSEKMRYWRRRILRTTWITYAGFYLARVNMSIALPKIMEEYGISKTAIGGVLTSLFVLYAIGQFINGQLGDKFGPRKLITVGIMGSVLLNVIFGFNTGGIMAMMIIWGLNGYFQSMGWAPSVKMVANWFPKRERGKAGGLLGSSYQIGNAISWGLAGLVIGYWGWRWGFWIPAVIFALLGLHWFIRARNVPEEVGLPTIEQENNTEINNITIKKGHYLGIRYTLRQTLLSPRIWIVGLGLFCLNIVRYGFLSWAPTYMFEIQKAAIPTIAFKAIAFPLAGSMGAFFAGWFSDRYLGSKRAPMSMVMLIILAVFIGLYPQIHNWTLSLMCLMIIGFFIFGPHVMMVGIMPMDFGTRKASSSAAGFIDSLGYAGASLTGVGTGWLLDNFGWNAAFYFWLIAAIIAAGAMLLLWDYKSEKERISVTQYRAQNYASSIK